MLFGIVTTADRSIDQEQFLSTASSMRLHEAHSEFKNQQIGSTVAMGCSTPYRTDAYQNCEPFYDKERGIATVFSGHLHNLNELKLLVGGEFEQKNSSSALVAGLYKKFGESFANKLKGKFCYAVWDQQSNRCFVGRDHLGIEPIYLYQDDSKIIFCSSIAPILSYLGASPNIRATSLSKFLLFGYNPSYETFYENIEKIPPSHYVEFGRDLNLKTTRYWNLVFESNKASNEADVADEVRQRMQLAVDRCMSDSGEYGVFVSGGMDSSSVLGLGVRNSDKSPHTFSYRCRGESFDESPYARLMAESVGSIHKEIEFASDDVLLMTDIVAKMDEPFCDIGINIATYLLGKNAGDSVSYVMTGDGGDELFGGHPIYEADQIAQYVDKVPGLLKQPFFHLAAKLPDTDKKKNLTVKLKRFFESMRYPKDLLSHRWRIYYQPDELDLLMKGQAYDQTGNVDLYSDLLTRNSEAADLDLLSRSLYSDYFSVLDFYIRRNDLTRAFGVETRYPLLDIDLVEYCATIPVDLKIKGWFDTKYIMKKSMEPILPEKIVYRKDKLGHSIPLKNWMRDVPKVREFILDHLSEEAVSRRGYFDSKVINRMINEHMRKQTNHSHRLWTLAVLEMWFRAHE